MKKTFLYLLLLVVGLQASAQNKNIIANPLNLNYRFQPTDKGEYRREAADPVCEYFKGKYYLFASKSGGYWSSPDLIDWTYIPCKTITELDNYAPAILIMDDVLYFIASGSKIYKTTNPDIDNWEQLSTDLKHLGDSRDPYHDPAFFQDDDGRVYFYWGCSDRFPIEGIELDPSNNLETIGDPVTLITHNPDKYGWEVRGRNNNSGKNGYNEGPCIVKHKGKYYLHYAAPGTEYRNYGDGIYISDKPLGPYTYVENSPFSFKPGGFIAGAGHGHTFKDKYGNYWHVATMTVSVRHMFERRIGLFPTYMAKDDNLYAHTAFTDYPFYIPNKKTNLENNNLSKNWNLLSYEKNVEASSYMPGYEVGKANDEQVETWWSAQSRNRGEWWQVDLGRQMEVEAVQVNFADHGFNLTDKNSFVNYQYYVESSDNGTDWKRIISRTNNQKDMPHELIVLDKPVKTRYLRITNAKDIVEGKFSMFDFRVFGNGKGKAPQKVSNFKAQRKDDRRRFQFTWDKVEGATGYIINWGVNKDYLKNSTMVVGDNQVEAGYFNRDSEYFFSIDSFNENGITKGKDTFSVK